MKMKTFLLATGAIAALATVQAQAASIVLYNTGVDAGSAVQANNSAEIHYAFSGGAARTADSTNGYPIGPWLGDDALSSWIGPVGDSILNGPTGLSAYQLTFSLAGLDPTTAVITGRFAADDVSDIYLNGATTLNHSGGFTFWTPFTISSGFTAGVNILDFYVHNSGGPTGLRVEMTGTARSTGAVPEPASWAMMIGGFAIAGAALRRRKVVAVRFG